MAMRRKPASRRAKTTRRTPSRRTTTRSSRRVARPWTREEIQFMRKYYRKFETSWIARQLRRSVYSVRYKAVDLNIKKAAPSVWKGNRGAANAFRRPTTRRATTTRTRKPASRRRTTRKSYRASSMKKTGRKPARRRIQRRRTR